MSEVFTPAFVTFLSNPAHAEALALAASTTKLLETADAASTASATATHFAADATMASARPMFRRERVASVLAASEGGSAPSGSARIADARTISSGIGSDEADTSRTRSNGRLSAHAVTTCLPSGRRLSAPAMALRAGAHEHSGGTHGRRLRINGTPNAPPPRRRSVVDAAYTPSSLGLCL